MECDKYKIKSGRNAQLGWHVHIKTIHNDQHNDQQTEQNVNFNEILKCSKCTRIKQDINATHTQTLTRTHSTPSNRWTCRWWEKRI